MTQEEIKDSAKKKAKELVDIFSQNYSARTVTVATHECGKWSTDRDDEDIIEINVVGYRYIEEGEKV